MKRPIIKDFQYIWGSIEKTSILEQIINSIIRKKFMRNKQQYIELKTSFNKAFILYQNKEYNIYEPAHEILLLRREFLLVDLQEF